MLKVPTFQSNRAFTMVELLVTVGILGVLLSVAVPKYRRYLARAHVTEAVVRGSSVAVAQEVYRTTSNAYSEDLALLDPTNDLPKIRSTVWEVREGCLLVGGGPNSWGWEIHTDKLPGIIAACATNPTGHGVQFVQAPPPAALTVSGLIVVGCE